MLELSWIGSLSVLAPSLVAALLYRKFEFPIQKRLALLIGFYLMVEGISNYLILYRPENNDMPFYHFYMIVDFSMLIWIFNLILPRIITLRVQYVAFAILGSVFLYEIVEGDLIYHYPTLLKSVQGAVAIILCVIFFWKMMRDDVKNDLLKMPSFWFSAGVLIYQGANLVVFASSDYLESLSVEIFYAVWSYLHTALLIVFYLLIIKAFRCRK